MPHRQFHKPEKPPEQRAGELIAYCMYHITEPEDPRDLYRIFYYDCPPMKRVMTHPLDGTEMKFAEGKDTKWAIDFYEKLSSNIKVALRMGELAENTASYMLKEGILEDLIKKRKTVDDLTKNDFFVNVKQKGVDREKYLPVTIIYIDRITFFCS